MSLWTKKVAVQTIGRDVTEAELTGRGNWLDVQAREKERSQEELPGHSRVNGGAPHWHKGEGGLKRQQWVHLDLLILGDRQTSLRRRSVTES